MTTRRREDRGLAVLEFALIAPMLIALVLGAVEFGERYRMKAVYGNAAQVAARSYSLTNDASAATTAAHDAGVPSSVTPTYAFKFDSGASASSCTPAADGTQPSVTVTITRTDIPAVTTMAAVIPGAGNTYSITRTAVARCQA